MDEGGGVRGERGKSEEVVDGGDKRDLGGMVMGFAKLEEEDSEGGEGESDRSLLVSLPVSLPLSSENMFLPYMVVSCQRRWSGGFPAPDACRVGTVSDISWGEVQDEDK